MTFKQQTNLILMFHVTTATEKIQKLTKRLRCVSGGTSASKTISILLVLIDLAQRDTISTTTSIVSESFPHLKRGAMRDFLMIMEQHKYYKDHLWNKSDAVYTFETGSKIEFFSADQPDKVRGPRRDRLFINEANNVPYSTFDQLEVRTKDFIFLDWNPVSEFWYYTEIKDRRSDYDELILTYKDNESLSPEIVKSIEQRRGNANWWRVYGEGLLGTAEGRIYKDWAVLKEIPHEAKLERRGIDFGYTNDPTAIVDIYKYNNAFILDEVCYQKGLSNKQICDIIKLKEPTLCIADSSEPKSIDELKANGINVIPSLKGRGSINQGIQFVQDQRISVTSRSLNILKEYRNYLWRVDREGITMNEPEGGKDHAMDAIRYGFTSYNVFPIEHSLNYDLYSKQTFT